MSKIIERFDELLGEAQKDGGLYDCYAEPLRELFMLALQSKVDSTSTNNAITQQDKRDCDTCNHDGECYVTMLQCKGYVRAVQ